MSLGVLGCPNLPLTAIDESIQQNVQPEKILELQRQEKIGSLFYAEKG